MTMTSTVLAPILTPLITWMMAGTFVHVDALSMFFSIVQVVILPIVVGFVIQKYCPRFTSRAVGYLPAFSSVAITFIVGIIVSHNAEKLLTSGLLIILVVMLHNICGLLLGFSIGKLLKLEYKKCVAISIEVGMQIRVLPVPWPLFILQPIRWLPFLVLSSVYGIISVEH